MSDTALNPYRPPIPRPGPQSGWCGAWRLCSRGGLPRAEPFDAAKVVEQNAPVVHRCASCGAPYDPADYSEEAAHIYCGSCKAELPRFGAGRPRATKVGE